jgi:hypothetical protein
LLAARAWFATLFEGRLKPGEKIVMPPVRPPVAASSAMEKLVYIVLGLAGLLVAYWLAFELDLLTYVIIAIASVIPPAACLVASSRVPRLVQPLIYLLCSAAIVWLLHLVGDYLLPDGAMIHNRHSTIDASGDYMATFTGIMLTLYGIAALWFMIAEARARRREERLAEMGAPPGARRARRHGGKSSRRRSSELPGPQ